MGKILYSEEEYREAAIIWKKNNLDVELIPQSAVIVISSGKEVPVGNRLNAMRKNLKKNSDYLSLEEKNFWQSYGLFKESKKKETYSEEEYREAAIIWKKENPDIDKIPSSVVIKIESGRDILIGIRMQTMRRKLSKNPNYLTEEQKEFWTDYGLYKEERIYDSFTEEEYREAAIIWKKENPTSKMIPSRTIVKISSGKDVSVGNRFTTMRKKLKKDPDYINDDAKAFWADYGLFEEVVKKEGSNSKKHSETLDRYITMFDGNVTKAEKAVNTLRELRKKRNAKKTDDYLLTDVLEEFDINLDTLNKYLTRANDPDKKKEVSIPLKYEGITLKKYCLDRGLNYNVIYKAVTLHKICNQDDLESLINRVLIDYQHEGQNKPATWIYEKYGVLVSHILFKLGLDSNKILGSMTKYTISLEEAMRHEVFRLNREDTKNSWLEELYNYLIEEIDANKNLEQTQEDLVDMFIILKDEFTLDKNELTVLWNCFYRYVETIKNFQIIDVGLETDKSEKMKKIEAYNFDDLDIEESFFVPLEFEENVLIGRKSELYKRRQLIRQYCIDWNYYSLEEQEKIILENKFSSEEIYYINKTRKEIDEVVTKKKIM